MSPKPPGVTQEDWDDRIYEEVHGVSYVELRSWCRQLGVSGAGKAEVLRERVMEALEKEKKQEDRKEARGKEAKAAKEATAAEAASHIPLNEEPRSPKSGVKRRHRKLSTLQQEAQGAAEAAEEKAEDIAHVVKAAAAKGAKDLNAAWDAAKEKVAPAVERVERPIAETQAEAANYASNMWSRLREGVASWVPAGTSWRLLLAMFLLGVVAGTGLTMLAHPHAWQDVRHRTNVAVTTASDGAGTLLRSASQVWSEAFPRGQWASQGNDGRVPLHCRAALATRALPTLLPPPDAGLWGHVAADVRALSPLEGGAPLRKGLGLLLVCTTAQQCAAAVQGLWTHVPEPCTDCLLVILEGELVGDKAEARGQLQRRLAKTLQRCPYAAVAIDASSIAAAPEVALPVLINALSERGHFQQGGEQVSSSEAVYVVTMAAPRDGQLTAAAAASEDAFSSAAKAAFVNMVSGSEGAPASGLAEALRRRLDVVSPARGSGLDMQPAAAEADAGLEQVPG